MSFGVLFERVRDAWLSTGLRYDAHVPGPGLATPGLGMEGAKAAALNLARLWLADKRANGEAPASLEVLGPEN